MSEPVSEVPSRWDRDHPFPAPLLIQQRLTAAASQKDVRHIEIGLAGSGLHYMPGDTLGIWVRNDPDLVADVLQACGLDPSCRVMVYEE